jgi:murein DD-endopeptidase MepM/ murein hydrolase activator NlpD
MLESKLNCPLHGFCLILWGTLLVSSADAQEVAERIRPETPGSGIVVEWPTAPPLSREIIEQARRRQLELEARGLLDSTRTASRPTFVWPLRQSRDHLDRGYWATLGFVDHDPRYPDYLLDYNGGERTYDLPSGYNHQGTDLVAWPFGWVKVALDQVEIVAAAAGTVLTKVDGNFDRECSADFEEEREANYVIVAHQDGSLAVYGHLKKGSLTKKQEGTAVEKGEYLGILGSSGYSGYPHLHFEVYNSSEELVDPFAGPHNDMTSNSWWREQPPYYDLELLSIMTHSAEPIGGQCKNAERTHVARRFAPGDDVYLAAYLRDLHRKQRVKYTVLGPDGEVFAKGKFKRLGRHALLAQLIRRLTLPEDAERGRWTYRVKLKRTELEDSFEVGEFEPSIAVRSVKPKILKAGTRKKVRIAGFGFAPGLAADIQSRDALERNIEIRKAKIKKNRLVLTVVVRASASPGPRDLVLTSPDYTQLIVDDALQVGE